MIGRYVIVIILQIVCRLPKYCARTVHWPFGHRRFGGCYVVIDAWQGHVGSFMNHQSFEADLLVTFGMVALGFPGYGTSLPRHLCYVSCIAQFDILTSLEY
jgi:hypothetical protein